MLIDARSPGGSEVGKGSVPPALTGVPAQPSQKAAWEGYNFIFNWPLAS
jgi:hypothetical protein